MDVTCKKCWRVRSIILRNCRTRIEEEGGMLWLRIKKGGTDVLTDMEAVQNWVGGTVPMISIGSVCLATFSYALNFIVLCITLIYITFPLVINHYVSETQTFYCMTIVYSLRTVYRLETLLVINNYIMNLFGWRQPYTHCSQMNCTLNP